MVFIGIIFPNLSRGAEYLCVCEQFRKGDGEGGIYKHLRTPPNKGRWKLSLYPKWEESPAMNQLCAQMLVVFILKRLCNLVFQLRAPLLAKQFWTPPLSFLGGRGGKRPKITSIIESSLPGAEKRKEARLGTVTDAFMMMALGLWVPLTRYLSSKRKRKKRREEVK